MSKNKPALRHYSKQKQTCIRTYTPAQWISVCGNTSLLFISTKLLFFLYR